MHMSCIVTMEFRMLTRGFYIVVEGFWLCHILPQLPFHLSIINHKVLINHALVYWTVVGAVSCKVLVARWNLQSQFIGFLPVNVHEAWGTIFALQLESLLIYVVFFMSRNIWRPSRFNPRVFIFFINEIVQNIIVCLRYIIVSVVALVIYWLLRLRTSSNLVHVATSLKLFQFLNLRLLI